MIMMMMYFSPNLYGLLFGDKTANSFHKGYDIDI